MDLKDAIILIGVITTSITSLIAAVFAGYAKLEAAAVKARVEAVAILAAAAVKAKALEGGAIAPAVVAKADAILTNGNRP